MFQSNAASNWGKRGQERKKEKEINNKHQLHSFIWHMQGNIFSADTRRIVMKKVAKRMVRVGSTFSNFREVAVVVHDWSGVPPSPILVVDSGGSRKRCWVEHHHQNEMMPWGKSYALRRQVRRMPEVVSTISLGKMAGTLVHDWFDFVDVPVQTQLLVMDRGRS